MKVYTHAVTGCSKTLGSEASTPSKAQLGTFVSSKSRSVPRFSHHGMSDHKPGIDARHSLIAFGATLLPHA